MDSKETNPPDVISFEGRCYRLDRISAVREDDVVAVRRDRKPYSKPTLRHLGSVSALTLSPSTAPGQNRKHHG
jgi:hypothetical protein